jgi:hypothetical protein
MNKNSKRVFILALIILFILTACNLPFSKGKAVSATEENGSESSPSGGLFNNNNEEKITPTPTIDPNPVGIQEGLGSFDSYRLRVQMDSSDSTGKIDNFSEYIERSVVNKSTHSYQESTSFDPENDTEQNTSTDETYEVGLVTCSSDGEGGWTYSDMTEQDQELADIFKGMVDFIPVIDNPEYVGSETVNGTPCNHFTFKLEGIGTKSGSVAQVNKGEYWVAQDGQYLVKYSLDLEIHSADDSEVSKMEMLMDLTDVNSDVIEITLPDNCTKTEEE